jgi:hypothetical protein
MVLVVGSALVLATKPSQEDIPWRENIWRLCVSYRRLNQVARQFAFPIRRCSKPIQRYMLPRSQTVLASPDCTLLPMDNRLSTPASG